MDEEVVIKRCKNCGKEFTVDKKYANVQKFCSKECREESTIRKKKAYQASYYKKVTYKKRILDREKSKKIAENIAENASNISFFDLVEYAVEIMKITNSDKNEQEKLLCLMRYIEGILAENIEYTKDNKDGDDNE